MPLEKKLIFWTAVIALLGTVTNFVYFSPLLTLLVPLCVYILLKERLQRPIAWLYAYLLLFLAGVMAYDLPSLVDYGFYRRDGNFVISYAPLLVLPLFRFRFELEKYLRRFYLFAAVLYGVLLLAYLAGSEEYAFSGNPFGGLFYAQNAVGGFLALLGALGFAYARNRGGWREWAGFGLIFLALLATYSRGSILGLALGIPAWYLAVSHRWKSLLLMLLIPVVITAGVLWIGYPYYKTNEAMGMPFDEQVLYADVDEEDSTKGTNVLLRVFYTMPRAWYAFIHSPVLGTGVGSFDDRPYRFRELVPGVRYNAQPDKRHTDSHAHHSYLHILAEQGVAGLALFLTFWVSLFFFLMRIKGMPVVRDYLLVAYFAITFASFTEHRITTPSMMLPFSLSVGLYLTWRAPGPRYRIVPAGPGPAGEGEGNGVGTG